jgi:hypothetical protein
MVQIEEKVGVSVTFIRKRLREAGVTRSGGSQRPLLEGGHAWLRERVKELEAENRSLRLELNRLNHS